MRDDFPAAPMFLLAVLWAVGATALAVQVLGGA